jgi:8-oxo-dGTP diphosphatase
VTQPPSPPKAAVSAAIVVHDNRVLLVRRRVAEGALSWQFPAGKVELGETPAQAAVRETMEETCLTVRADTLLGERTHPATGRRMYYTACTYQSGEPRVGDADELDRAEWVEHAQLAELVPAGFYEPVQRFLDEELKH